MKRLAAFSLMFLAAAAARGATNDLVAEGTREGLAQHNEKAVELFKAALAQDPGNHNAMIALGTVYLQMKNYRGASAILQPLLDADPSNYIVMNNLAWIHAEASEPDLFNPAEAVRLARAAVALAPQDYHVWSTVSESLYAQGDFEEALRAAEQTLRLAQEDGRASDWVPAYRAQVEKCGQATRALTLVE